MTNTSIPSYKHTTLPAPPPPGRHHAPHLRHPVGHGHPARAGEEAPEAAQQDPQGERGEWAGQVETALEVEVKVLRLVEREVGTGN